MGSWEAWCLFELVLKDPPPPYRTNDNAEIDQQNQSSEQIGSQPCEVLDLVANCKIDDQETPEYEEIREMGLWHSTPLAHRHKSKISLTWVLKENLENAKIPEKIQSEERIKSGLGSDINKHRYVNERYRKCKQVSRVIGRNEYYHNLRFRSACEEFVGHAPDSCSESSEEYSKRRHKHRHRKKKKPRERFGYDIKDLDSFLSEASIDRPGNIPVVIAYPSTLYQTHKECQRELTLPLGTVVNAVFKNEHWLYAQTPHGAEGYVLTSPQKKTPCWESSTDIYPRPCGNLTDTEKEQLRGRTRSECRYQRVNKKSTCAERDFDTLYLKTKSVSNIDKLIGNDVFNSDIGKFNSVKDIRTKRQTLLVVTSDYVGSGNTLNVQHGDVVVLLQRGETDVDAEWFYVRKSDGSQGFIPAKIAGNGYI
ncbi:hypothetical protein OBRU01_09546 [Operophtera brumata]|uniref:SH3 domain-containing protein n=1 Tax=Operophtera brumata TaxID=104452 RepID=A0A0L7LFK9_OPEBR|nr:hypothetical protein OBRU01_09546 [Operophtera brumata]